MPGFAPGAPVLADNQATLRSTLMGAGTNYCFDPAKIKGLGLPSVRDHDFDLAGVDGADGGDDTYGVRIITFGIEIATGNYTSAMTAYKSLLAVWARSSTNIELRMRLPGFGEFYVMGRPRGLDEDLANMEFGIVLALARFDALDPTLYFV